MNPTETYYMATTKQGIRKLNWMHILRKHFYQVTGWWMFVQQRTKQLETQGCVLCIVVTIGIVDTVGLVF